jgi:transposase
VRRQSMPAGPSASRSRPPKQPSPTCETTPAAPPAGLIEVEFATARLRITGPVDPALVGTVMRRAR